jgi:hypothetical protein
MLIIGCDLHTRFQQTAYFGGSQLYLHLSGLPTCRPGG